MNSKEEAFFETMKSKEVDLVKDFTISRICMRYILPKLKTYVALSVPYAELNSHLTTMMNVQCHLIWTDSILINKINYFNLIWQSNDEIYQINSLDYIANTNSTGVVDSSSSFPAKSPSFMIFFDLNTAQLAQINHELTIESDWTIQLVESYLKTPDLKVIKPKSGRRPQTTKSGARDKSQMSSQKSVDEIFYICQFKKKTNEKEKSLKLQHGIIDNRFDEAFKETVKYKAKTSIHIPLRSTPLLVNVNTISNKHFYYTSLYMPYDNYKPLDAEDYNENLSDLKQTSLYYTRNNLNDLDILGVYDSFSKNSWKLIDLKAYRDVNCLTKFSMIWTKLCFYEGTSRLFVGLNKNETLDKIDEMTLKGLYPKIVTSYCYSSTHGEHLYALFFCQF